MDHDALQVEAQSKFLQWWEDLGRVVAAHQLSHPPQVGHTRVVTSPMVLHEKISECRTRYSYATLHDLADVAPALSQLLHYTAGLHFRPGRGFSVSLLQDLMKGYVQTSVLHYAYANSPIDGQTMVSIRENVINEFQHLSGLHSNIVTEEIQKLDAIATQLAAKYKDKPSDRKSWVKIIQSENDNEADHTIDLDGKFRTMVKAYLFNGVLEKVYTDMVEQGQAAGITEAQIDRSLFDCSDEQKETLKAKLQDEPSYNALSLRAIVLAAHDLMLAAYSGADTDELRAELAAHLSVAKTVAGDKINGDRANGHAVNLFENTFRVGTQGMAFEDL